MNRGVGGEDGEEMRGSEEGKDGRGRGWASRKWSGSEGG